MHNYVLCKGIFHFQTGLWSYMRSREQSVVHSLSTWRYGLNCLSFFILFLSTCINAVRYSGSHFILIKAQPTSLCLFFACPTLYSDWSIGPNQWVFGRALLLWWHLHLCKLVRAVLLTDQQWGYRQYNSCPVSSYCWSIWIKNTESWQYG